MKGNNIELIEFEYDKASGQLFCKYCGENYLSKEHKKECLYLRNKKKSIKE